jgi:signal transduction histidine kinase/CheY-like chemotaxis protein
LPLLSAQPGKDLFLAGYTDNAIVHHGVLGSGTTFIARRCEPVEEPEGDLTKTHPLSEAQGARKSPWASEVSVRFAHPYLDEYEKLCGEQELDRFLTAWGTDSREIRADESQWISIAFLESLCDALVEKSGSEEVVVRCGRLGITRKYIGYLYPVIRLLGTPGTLYDRLEKLTESLNKVNRVQLEKRGWGSARISYLPGDVVERSEHICTARKAQLAAIPSVWDLPDARLTEIECVHKGGQACRYDIKWEERVFAIGGVLGLAGGLATMLLHWGWLHGSCVPYLLFSILCLTTGFLFDLVRRNREAQRFADEQNRALTAALEASNTHFDRVLRETDRRYQAEDQATVLQGQLDQSQKLETVGRLAGGIAHDFNNLLTVINSYAQFATEGLREGDPLKADLQQIKEAGDRAASLTRQLLAFSRKQVLEPQILDLNTVVNSLDSMARRLIGEDIELRTVLDRHLGMVNADPGQLEQVLMNLVVNARDAMPLGGKLTVETTNIDLDEEFARTHADSVAGPYAMLSVTDTGEGMTAIVRDRIFEPFYTTKEKGRGTGLGLATVYGIIKQSGGNIWVYSEPGQGTTFKIYLPRVESEAAQTAPAPRETLDLRGNETVLVVEDESAVRYLASRILKSAGYHPIAAANGGEALLECEQHSGRIQLVLTDVIMPKMSGKELAERLEKQSPGLRVLYMSGYTDDAIVQHGVLEKGTHFLSKPFNAPDLLKKVRQVLDSE